VSDKHPREIPIEKVAEAIAWPSQGWAHRCHEVSLAIVKAKLWPGSRVGRGWSQGVIGQHSWVVVGDDCYAADALIVDPTLWSYDETVTGIWYGSAEDGRHVPHGAGNIWRYGRPQDRTGPAIELVVKVSPMAEHFLQLAGPDGLDDRGWAFLAHAPVGGWPAAEILAAMADTPGLGTLIPVDRLGMLTNRNPGGLYLPGDEKAMPERANPSIR
jgi:hypothetical protein